MISEICLAKQRKWKQHAPPIQRCCRGTKLKTPLGSSFSPQASTCHSTSRPLCATRRQRKTQKLGKSQGHDPFVSMTREIEVPEDAVLTETERCQAVQVQVMNLHRQAKSVLLPVACLPKCRETTNSTNT